MKAIRSGAPEAVVPGWGRAVAARSWEGSMDSRRGSPMHIPTPLKNRRRLTPPPARDKPARSVVTLIFFSVRGHGGKGRGRLGWVEVVGASLLLERDRIDDSQEEGGEAHAIALKIGVDT